MSVKLSQKSVLTLDATPEAFFFELVQSAMQHQKIKLLPETEFYLVRLLNRFITSNLQDQPLAILYKEAMESETPSQKLLFQNLGDITLYKAGFFQESLNRNCVDLDYYIGMGGSAYLNAARRSDDRHFQNLFSELSDKFGRFVDVLFEVSEKTTITKTEQDLFRLYEMYERTGSERAARALKKAGIRIEKESKD